MLHQNQDRLRTLGDKNIGLFGSFVKGEQHSMINKETCKSVQSLCERHQVEMLILFGSFTTDTTHAQSDVDIAVLPAMGADISKLHLIHELEPLFNHRQIDLIVITKNTDPLLLFEIFSNGQLIFERSTGIFDINRLKACHLYLDTKPLRLLEKKYNLERIRALDHVT